ncbi:hypothetical protein HA72_1084 [Metallosphaera sedula]|uniref:Uncharacterized protein n=4 Tax=Metallosphaera TaxID=41980 RepID=A4YFP6_METS5|nr:hypothetical protein Msed_1084 [Metallosphaera sedula DSM 5348]AIM27234.1 hypothetical protein HA72_1084 [Metallosphaera sedula]BBL47111.1 hypothetical protein MJ1HA_1212 [Metallosphaera sedula]
MSLWWVDSPKNDTISVTKVKCIPHTYYLVVNSTYMNFLDKFHENRYEMAMALAERTYEAQGFTYVETIDRLRDFVIGQDQGIVYVLEVHKNCVDVRKCLGINYLYHEPYQFQDGISIGVLDLVVKVVKSFRDESELRSYILDKELIQFEARDYMYLRNLSETEHVYQSFVNSLHDKEVEELAFLSRNYMEMYRILDRNPEGVDKLEEKFREVEAEILRIAGKNGVEYVEGYGKLDPDEHISEDEEHIEREVERPLDVLHILAQVRARKVRENLESFLRYLRESEGPVSWGPVKVNGVLLDSFERRTGTFLILRPGDLVINRGGEKRIHVEPGIVVVENLE